jgi:hypothetical protein
MFHDGACTRQRGALTAGLLEIQEHFGLPSPALVEKDWYMVKALSVIKPRCP